jgi:hypothetical protein
MAVAAKAHLPEDLTAVFEHNSIPEGRGQMRGMQAQLRDLETVCLGLQHSQLKALIDGGCGSVAPFLLRACRQGCRSCFGADVQAVKGTSIHRIPVLRHRAGLLRTARRLTGQLPRIFACRTSDKTRHARSCPTADGVIERCSSRSGAYAVKKEYRTLQPN